MKLFKKIKREIGLQNPQENCWMREKILLFFLKKGTFVYEGNVFKTKEEELEEESEEESEENKLEKKR